MRKNTEAGGPIAAQVEHVATPQRNGQQSYPVPAIFFDRICCINLKRRPDRWEALQRRMTNILGDETLASRQFLSATERIEAVDGQRLVFPDPNYAKDQDAKPTSPDRNSIYDSWHTLCATVWDATNNARWDPNIRPPFLKPMTRGELGCALSHIQLWQELANNTHHHKSMLILEDDIIPYPGKRYDKKRSGFIEALGSAMDGVPSDWDILYLGFCNFGPRRFLDRSSEMSNDQERIPVQVYRPTYGFYTHAYALTKTAAQRLLQELPMKAPIDVWLADNNWFGLQTYVGVVPMTIASPSSATPETRHVSLISQRRVDSDIVHSAHHKTPSP